MAWYCTVSVLVDYRSHLFKLPFEGGILCKLQGGSKTRHCGLVLHCLSLVRLSKPSLSVTIFEGGLLCKLQGGSKTRHCGLVLHFLSLVDYRSHLFRLPFEGGLLCKLQVGYKAQDCTVSGLVDCRSHLFRLPFEGGLCETEVGYKARHHGLVLHCLSLLRSTVEATSFKFKVSV